MLLNDEVIGAQNTKWSLQLYLQNKQPFYGSAFSFNFI